MIEVKIPDIGDSQEVTVIEILVAVGDVIKKEQSLITLETDKATVEVPSPDSGQVEKISVKVGDKVQMGDHVLLLKSSDVKIDTKLQSEKIIDTKSINLKDNIDTEKSIDEISVDIIIPDIGTEESVEVIEVFVKSGDTVNKEQSLFTIESEKASMDIPAPFAGVLKNFKIIVGDKVNQGDNIGSMLSKLINKSESKSQPHQPIAEKILSKEVEKANDIQMKSNIKSAYAGPGVRRLARDLGVDLSDVSGSGRKNRIIKEDLYSYVKNKIKGEGNPQTNNDFIGKMPQIDFSKYGDIEEQNLSRIKIISGKFLHRNWLHIPHVTHFEEADITDLEDFRKLQKDAAQKQGIRLTPLVFLMRAIVAALQEFPRFNSSLAPSGDKLIIKKYYHIGIAVDTPNGLVVPVVRDVDKKGLFQLAIELGEISIKARDAKLKPGDMQGGCFSISSLGGIGGHAFTPIVNAPEVAILGVSKSSHKPIYQNGEFVPRLMLPLSLSYDHRVIDGAEAARFSKYLVEKLSDIRRLLL
jgi:pyruvate dehydrogenase E2 component (dihydrolipoamide acetyltransferase)